MIAAALIYVWVFTLFAALFLGVHMISNTATRSTDIAVYTIVAGLWPVCILVVLWRRWQQHKGEKSWP